MRLKLYLSPTIGVSVVDLRCSRTPCSSGPWRRGREFGSRLRRGRPEGRSTEGQHADLRPGRHVRPVRGGGPASAST
eukprot:157044-Alexandrium_andersonii.AAC.1